MSSTCRCFQRGDLPQRKEDVGMRSSCRSEHLGSSEWPHTEPTAPQSCTHSRKFIVHEGATVLQALEIEETNHKLEQPKTCGRGVEATDSAYDRGATSPLSRSCTPCTYVRTPSVSCLICPPSPTHTVSAADVARPLPEPRIISAQVRP